MELVNTQICLAQNFFAQHAADIGHQPKFVIYIAFGWSSVIFLLSSQVRQVMFSAEQRCEIGP